MVFTRKKPEIRLFMQVVYLGGKDKHWQGGEEVRWVREGCQQRVFRYAGAVSNCRRPHLRHPT